MEKSKNRKDILEISKAWDEAKKQTITLYRREIDEDIQLFEEIQKDEKFVAFTNYFDENDTIAFQILNDLSESWAIYTNYRKSHKDRVKLIRRNFWEQYLVNEQSNPNSKYFIKIGSLHAGKKDLSFGNYDIGALTEELAQLNNSKSLNICIKVGYYDGDDEYKKMLMPFTNFAQLEQWTIIDLSSIQSEIKSGKLSIIGIKNYNEVAKTLDNYDLIIIPPNDYDPTPNYTSQ
ncbi:hypothetical protein [Flammeovirga aprica]|uniref:Uncharacterized protein n=1 Tax=Flammeovirga aprica JL-4 TaxID=694437 RepID=A0A7X9P1B8_9BACT|nr:hypothetical protein [Flammeovirga aprica]NME67615.1 hypothetical protein [Flammeovirga aprica JL-4]